MRECLFEPQLISQKFDNIESHYAKDNILDNIKVDQMKKEKIQRILRK